MKKIKIFLPILGDCEITPQCDQCVYSFGVYSTMDGIKVKCKKCGAELPIHRIAKRKKMNADDRFIIKIQIYTMYGMHVDTDTYHDPLFAITELARKLGYEIDFKKKSKKK